MNHLELLGTKVRDKVTNFEGIVTCVSFDLYGCIQAVVTPRDSGDPSKDAESKSRWMDVSRIEMINNVPVMEVPNFAEGIIAAGGKGPTFKPGR